MWRYLHAAGLTVVMILSALATLAGLHWAERSVFPVVTDWRVTAAWKADGFVHVQGTLNKQRECKLIQTTVRLIPPGARATPVLLAQITPTSDHGLGLNVPVGPNEWGPFRFPAIPKLVMAIKNGGYVEVVAMHRCHALWVQETHYGVIDADVIGDVL